MTDEINVSGEEVLDKPSMFGMIMSPGVQFERIRKNPKVLLAIVIITILTTLGMFMLSKGIDYTNQPGFETMGEEELMYVTMFANITMIVTGLFTPILSILISSLIYFAIAKMTHRDVGFKQLFSLNTYIFVISTLSLLINGLAMMLVGSGDGETLFTSVNSIVEAGGALGAFLNTIEVFTIWGMIITAIGLQIVAKFSKGLSWGIVIAFYVITTGFGMASAGFVSMMGA